MRSVMLARPAVEAARRALAELEDDEVPASLRRIAASSARALPPPQAAVLLRALEEAAWLRERAAEHLEGGDSLEDSWSEAFLRRPAGWEGRLEALERDAEAQRSAAGERSLEADNRRLSAKVARLERRLAEARAAEATREDRPDPDLVERLQESNRAIRTRIADVERALTEARTESEAFQAELERAERRIAELDRRLAAARSSKPDPAGGSPRSFGVGDPLALARSLDDLHRSLGRVAAAEPADRPARPLVFPPGIRPDRPEALAWLADLGDPVTVLVDGYNVAFQIEPIPGRAARNRVENLAGRLARLAAGPLSVVVFWDSEAATSPVRDVRRPTGVDIRFVRSADDAIVDAASSAPAAVVVTADRELQERAARHGALAVWSSALLDWDRR